MIRVSVMYPRAEGKRFDMDYYMNRHMPLVREQLGPHGLVAAEVDRGVAGMDGGEPPCFAVAQLTFDSIETFQKAFDAAGGPLVEDIPNYTDTQPVVQVSEVIRA